MIQELYDLYQNILVYKIKVVSCSTDKYGYVKIFTLCDGCKGIKYCWHIELFSQEDCK